MSARILVAGVGNVLLGDDGFGVEVAGRLVRDPPAGARVVDFGIRGIQLAYELLDGYDMLILVDAMARGNAPGTLYVFEPDEPDPAAGTWLDAHSLDPASVLSMVHMLGGTVGRTVVIGCEPGEIGEGIGLSAPVAAAVEEAMRVVRRVAAGEGHRAEDSREETSW
jgi:hydrogenase maturation protease